MYHWPSNFDFRDAALARKTSTVRIVIVAKIYSTHCKCQIPLVVHLAIATLLGHWTALQLVTKLMDNVLANQMLRAAPDLVTRAKMAFMDSIRIISLDVKVIFEIRYFYVIWAEFMISVELKGVSIGKYAVLIGPCATSLLCDCKCALFLCDR